MKIHYATMQFPVWPEAFAINDLSELQRRGARLTVHSLRGPAPETDQLIRDRGLESIRMSWLMRRTFWVFLPLVALHPVVFLWLAWTVVRYNVTRPVHLIKGLASLPRTLEIYTAIHLDRPDLVHVFWGHYPVLAALAVRRFLPQIPVTMFLGAYDLMWGYGCTPPAARAADAIFTHAEKNRSAIEAFGVSPEQIHRAYRGVDFDAFKEILERPANRRLFSLVSAGKLVPEKRFDRVLWILALLRQDWPEAQLTIVGDGPERGVLEQLAGQLGLSDAVRFTGSVPHRDVFEEMKQAEVFLFLSEKPSERLPNVVKEAIACRAITVVNQTEGIEELIPDREHGIVLSDAEGGEHAAGGAADKSAANSEGGMKGSPGTAIDADARLEQLAADEIAALWNDPERAGRIRENAWSHLREQFDLRTCMQIYIDKWEMLTGKPIYEEPLSDESLHDKPQAGDPVSGPGSQDEENGPYPITNPDAERPDGSAE